MKNSKNTKMAMGFAWYDQNAWQCIKDAAVDADEWEQTHSEWLEIANKVFSEMKAAGSQPRKVYIDANEFFLWCTKESKPVASKSVTQFVAEKLRQQDTGNRSPNAV